MTHSPFPAVALWAYLLTAPLSAAAQTTEERDAAEALSARQSGATMMLIPGSEAIGQEFRPLYADRPNGPNLLPLQGDPSTGPSLSLFRYSQDYTNSGGLHYHTHNYHLWVIEGELKHWDDTGSEETAPILGPGSYIYQPADLLHAANCVSERCTAYVLFDGPIQTGLQK